MVKRFVARGRFDFKAIREIIINTTSRDRVKSLKGSFSNEVTHIKVRNIILLIYIHVYMAGYYSVIHIVCYFVRSHERTRQSRTHDPGDILCNIFV